MDKPEFNFRFHNPNSDEAFAKQLLKVCIEAGKPKADEAIKAGITADEVAVTDGEAQAENKRRRL